MPLIMSKMASADHAHESYCSAPPLRTSSHLLLPPRISRAQEARRPHAPIREVKREVDESEPDSAEYGIGASDVIDVKPDVKPKIAMDHRQLTVRVAAIAIRPATSPASSPEAQSPSYRTQALCNVPSARLGPADPPRRPGRPKGSKSRPRIAAVATSTTPPVREAAKASAAKTRSSMASTSRRS